MEFVLHLVSLQYCGVLRTNPGALKRELMNRQRLITPFCFEDLSPFIECVIAKCSCQILFSRPKMTLDGGDLAVEINRDIRTCFIISHSSKTS